MLCLIIEMDEGASVRDEFAFDQNDGEQKSETGKGLVTNTIFYMN